MTLLRQALPYTDRVLLRSHRVSDGERVNQIHRPALAELFQRERVVEIGFFADHCVQLPVHQVGGKVLGRGELIAVELAELSQALAGQADSLLTVGESLRSQLPFQAILFLAREVARGGGEVGVPANPVRGEAIKKSLDVGVGVLLGGERKEAEQRGGESGFHLRNVAGFLGSRQIPAVRDHIGSDESRGMGGIGFFVFLFFPCGNRASRRSLPPSMETKSAGAASSPRMILQLLKARATDAMSSDFGTRPFLICVIRIVPLLLGLDEGVGNPMKMDGNHLLSAMR